MTLLPSILVLLLITIAAYQIILLMRLMEYLKENNPGLYKKVKYQLLIVPSVHKHNKRVSFVYYLLFHDAEDDQKSMYYKRRLRILLLLFFVILMSLVIL